MDRKPKITRLRQKAPRFIVGMNGEASLAEVSPPKGGGTKAGLSGFGEVSPFSLFGKPRDLSRGGFTIILILVTTFFCSGCGTTRRFKGIDSEVMVTIQESEKTFRVGETFHYNVRWLNIPVGEAELAIEEIVKIDGHDVYHITLRARTNKFMSTIYRVEDSIQTYIDVEGLYSHKFLKKQEERFYKSDEEIVFDHDQGKAFYHSLKNGSKKVFDIPKGVNDPLSVIYWFRTKEVSVGGDVHVDVNSDEKNWDLRIYILDKGTIGIPKLGVREVILVEPEAKHKGLLLKKGRMWLYFSADSKRIPLMMVVKAPIIGHVVATLDRIE